MKAFIFCFLLTGFFLLFRRVRILETASLFLKRTQKGMDMAARQRGLEERRQLLELQEKHSFWNRLERQLNYSGLKRRFPSMTVESWLAGNLAVTAVIFLLLAVLSHILTALAAVLAMWLTEKAVLKFLRLSNLRAVNEDLMKLLDFLGNYSITAGEVTGVFQQISRYMREPVKTALEQCSFEAQVTGDAGIALLSMAEKVEHPQFQELARNLEISIRYCADLKALVNSSRRSMREHLRIAQERKGMLREAVVNMALLLAMSSVVLFTVGHLIGVSVYSLLWETVPGRLGLAVLGMIFLMFWGQMQKVHR